MPEAIKLTPSQQLLVEDNMGLVHKVIGDYVFAPSKLGIFSREDLFQIGCEGLCKAAARYREAGKAEFSTYACVVIRNQIYDAMRYSTVRTRKEFPSEQPVLELQAAGDHTEPGDASDVYIILERITAKASVPIQKGSKALVMRAEGYTPSEICSALEASPGTIRMWISRARKHLAGMPEISSLAAAV